MNERKSFTGWQLEGDQVQASGVKVYRQGEALRSTTVNKWKSFTGRKAEGDQEQARKRYER